MRPGPPLEPSTTESNPSGAVRRRILQAIATYLVMAAILFLSAGRLSWSWAWIYLGVSLAILVVNAQILPSDLIAERGQPRDNVKRWDKALTALAGLPMLAGPIVTGLDERYGWSPQVAFGIRFLGLVLLVLGQGLFTWSMASNRYFSTLVRLQTDRAHTVATTGPYRYVRHPGYVGYTVSSLAMPLALGSLWALVPAGLMAGLLVVRTVLEDRTLQEELPGYREYARRVRYRLLPGIW